MRAHPTKQARSRETLDRLLDAAQALLADRGLDAATVPAIAKRAGLSVGVVYRRFPDKDTLMRAVYTRFFARASAQTRAQLDPARPRPSVPLDCLLEMMVRGMVAGYRQHRGILRALYLYAQTHHDKRFRRQAERLNVEGIQGIIAMLGDQADRIGHPDPAGAIEFVLLVMAAAMKALIIFDDRVPYPIARTDAQLADELTRMLTRYLDISSSDRAR